MDRVRCARCRNPIRAHQATAGPPQGGRTYHEDCWIGAVTLGAVGTGELQQDYQTRVAAGGLNALLAPYLAPASSELDLPIAPPVAVAVDDVAV